MFVRNLLGAVGLTSLLVIGPATAVAQSDTPAPTLHSATKAKTVQLAIAEVSKLPLPAMPELAIVYKDDLGAMGMQAGSTIYMDPSVSYWEQVATAIHEIGHYLDLDGGLDITPVVHEMRKTATVRSLFVCAQDGDDWCRYAMEPTELFARGFAQWVAMRSGNDRLLEGALAFGTGMWPDDDFAPVVPAFEALFGV